MNKREARLDRKYKSHLRCEWCNRWTSVSYQKWRYTSKDERGNVKDYIFYCNRPYCELAKKEGLIPQEDAKTIIKKKIKKNTHQSAQY